MIIESILLAMALAGAVACLSWSSVRNWLRNRSARRANLVKTVLRNGNYSVVAIGLNSAGAEVARKTWEAKSLDGDLAAQFRYGNHASITI